MSSHATPIVPTVLYIADQRHPWRLAKLDRFVVAYHTPTTVRVGTKAGTTRHQHQVYCLPDDGSWDRVQATQAALQAALDDLAAGLRALGSYATRLTEAGGMKAAPNPLSPTVILADDPDDPDAGGYYYSRLVPHIEREQVTSHTPKMLHIERGGKPWSTTHQRNHFVCPLDSDWQQIEQLHQAVKAAAQAWEQLLRELGAYSEALADGRYKKPVVIPQLDLRGPSFTPAPPVPNWPAITSPLIYGHHRNASAGGVAHVWQPAPTPRSKERHETLCHIVMTEPPHKVKAREKGESGPQLCPECRGLAAAIVAGQRAEANRKETFMTTTPVPARTGVRPAGSWGATDIDSALVGRLEAAGYHWEMAKQTPDGRWHHLISSRNTALLRNDQSLMRRERLEALLAPPARPIEQEPTVQALDRAIRGNDTASLAQIAQVHVGVPMMDASEAREFVTRIKTRIDLARGELLELHDREGWKALGYKSWQACAQAEFGGSAAQMFRLLSAAQIERAMDSPIGEYLESHLRPLGKLDTPTQQRQALERADQLAGDSPRTAKHVEQAVEEIKPKPATCIRCGAERSMASTRQFTTYQAGLVPEYGDRRVTLCSVCIPELLQLRKKAEQAGTPPAASFWQTLSAAHPTAHLWTQEELRLWRSACGVVAHTAPAGSHDGGHCSSCVRATWQQQPNIPELAPPAPTRLTCPTCGEPILNGVWGDLSECGSCYQARQRVTALSRPRRPVSADVSAQMGYLSDLEAYTTALERVFPRTPQAALFLASQLAGDRLEDRAEELSDAEYEALAAYRRDRTVPTLESEGIV